jgi:uncharacterized protein DUF6527
MKWLNRFSAWLLRLFQGPPRKVLFIEGDELPQELPQRDLMVAREGKTLWTAGMRCPCGCGRRLEVMLLPGVKPRWDLMMDAGGRPTLYPSVWVNDGCRSHFWLRAGRVEWC